MPGVKNRLKLTLINRRKRIALSPLTMKEKGTLDSRIESTRNKVAIGQKQ